MKDQRGVETSSASSLSLGIYERALRAFNTYRGDPVAIIDARLAIFGGSHAQRDIVQQALIEAALRAGDRSLATALCNERALLRPHCPFSWQLQRRAAIV